MELLGVQRGVFGSRPSFSQCYRKCSAYSQERRPLPHSHQPRKPSVERPGGSMRYSVLGTAQWYVEGSRLYGAKGFKNAAASFGADDLNVDMRGKVACVTGANSGIGYCVAKSLAEKNATVHMLCRNQARGEEARNRVLKETGNENVHLHVIDVSDFQQVETFASKFVASTPRLDVLVNNAGGMPPERVETPQGNEGIMATMLGGSHLLTKLLMPALENEAVVGGSDVNAADSDAEAAKGCRSSRVINISSGGMYTVSADKVAEDMDSRAVDPYDGTFIYALAKRAQVTLTELWAERPLSSSGRVCFNSMHPGWCDTPAMATGMSGFYEKQQSSMRSSEQGADTIVWLACSDAAEGETGKFWFDRKVTRTHMPLAGTRASGDYRNALWEAAEVFCSRR